MAKKAFSFRCEACGARLAAKKSWAGREVRCNKCNETVTVPQPPMEQEKPSKPPLEASLPLDNTTDRVAQEIPPGESGFRELFSRLGRWLEEGFRRGLANFPSIVTAALICAILNMEALLLWPFATALLTPVLAAGLALLLIETARGGKPSPWMLFSCFVDKRYWRSVAVFWLTMAVCAAATIPAAAVTILAHTLGVTAGVPGAIVAWIVTAAAVLGVLYVVSRVLWALPLVVDQRAGVMDSFRGSWRMTGRVDGGWGLFCLLLVLKFMGAAVSVIAGAISFLVFLAISNPLTSTAVKLPADSLSVKGAVHTLLLNVSPYSLGTGVGVVVFTLIWAVIAVMLWMPILVGYRESVPH